MGSEFAYEDLSSQEVEKYTYKYLRDEACGELQCFVIERIPVDRYSGYKRQLAWLDQQQYRPQKIVFHDRKDAMLKTLVYSEYKQFLENYWRAHDMFMENHQTGKSTRLIWDNYRFQTGLTERDFDRNSLKRAK